MALIRARAHTHTHTLSLTHTRTHTHTHTHTHTDQLLLAKRQNCRGAAHIWKTRTCLGTYACLVKLVKLVKLVLQVALEGLRTRGAF
jgi:hypothetical protein